MTKKNDTAKRFLTSPDEILSADDIRHLDVDVTEDWGGWVRLRSLNAGQAAAFIDMKPEERADMLPRLLCHSIVHPETGELMFKSEEHLERWKAKSMRPVFKLQTAMLELNGLNEKAAAAKNA